jgi:hypothetical protein
MQVTARIESSGGNQAGRNQYRSPVVDPRLPCHSPLPDRTNARSALCLPRHDDNQSPSSGSHHSQDLERFPHHVIANENAATVTDEIMLSLAAGGTHNPCQLPRMQFSVANSTRVATATSCVRG